jgi:hypothetical protein
VTPAEAKADLARWRATSSGFLLDPDGIVGRLYDARATPHMVVIDCTGHVVYMGPIGDTPSTRLADIKKERTTTTRSPPANSSQSPRPAPTAPRSNTETSKPGPSLCRISLFSLLFAAKITAVSLSGAEILGFGQNTSLLSLAVPGCFPAAIGTAFGPSRANERGRSWPPHLSIIARMK